MKLYGIIVAIAAPLTAGLIAAAVLIQDANSGWERASAFIPLVACVVVQIAAWKLANAIEKSK